MNSTCKIQILLPLFIKMKSKLFNLNITIYPCRKIAPTLLLDVPHDSSIMKEEIFGPFLPIVTVRYSQHHKT